ncbi:hypothetical protein ACFWNF_39515 [Streptomyces anulatus]|uniref:hypothetical protein n=2 Tax=Streptomyces TaxID=1883 RepID=UPI00364C4792
MQLLDRTHEDIKIPSTHPALLPPGISRVGDRPGGATQPGKSAPAMLRTLTSAPCRHDCATS